MEEKNENTKEKKTPTFAEAWKELKSSPKSLYFIFLLKFLESYSYFCIIYTLIIFLSEEYKYTDEQAGWSYGIFGMCTSVYGFVFGGYLIDNLGVKLSLSLGCCILFIGRCLLVLCTKHLHIILILYTVLPIGTCLGIPVMQIAIRRFTTEKSRALAYSIFYAMMNVSAIFSASAIDFFRKFITDQNISFSVISFELTAYKALFLSGACTTVFSMLISFFLISEADALIDESKKQSLEVSVDEINTKDNIRNCENTYSSKANAHTISNHDFIDEENSLLLTKPNTSNNNNLNINNPKSVEESYNYCSLSTNKNVFLNDTLESIATAANKKMSITNINHNHLIDVNLKNNNNHFNGSESPNITIFNSNKTITKALYQGSDKNHLNEVNKHQTEMQCGKLAGPCDVLGEVTAQKSFWKFVFMIILLMGVRIVYRHLDATFPKYMIREFGKDVMYGSIIAINPFLIVILIPIFAPLSYQFSAYSQITFGALITSLSPFFLALDTQMWSAIMFVVILSIGEALWSPRLYEYTIFITEEGREGIYMALASSPMFIATLITGATSGMLLESFCPEKGVKHSWKMWSLIGIITLTSPLLLFIFKKKIEITEDELTDERAEKLRKKMEMQKQQEQLLIEAHKKNIVLNYSDPNYFKHNIVGLSLSSNPDIEKKLNFRNSRIFDNLTVEEDKSFTLGNAIVRENEFSLTKNN